jgi:hypothetical protein
MDMKFPNVIACLCVAWLALHAPAAFAQIELRSLEARLAEPRSVEARSVVLAEESNGHYSESNRYTPSPQTVQYWVEPTLGAIRRSRIDGSDAVDVATSLNLPYGIAFDGESQELLWTSAGEEAVQKIAVAGGAPASLLSAFEEPYAIEASNAAQKIVYSSTGNVIYKDTIDLITGEESTQLLLVVVDEQPVHGLALDAAAGVLYIGDENGRMTRRIDLNGNISGHLIYSGTEPTLPPDPLPSPHPDPNPDPNPFPLPDPIPSDPSLPQP